MKKPKGKIVSAKLKRKVRRKLSTRKKVNGSEERPRVCVTKTNKNFFVQVVDDVTSKTLFSVQTYGKNAVKASSNKEGAKLVGVKLAEELKSRKIETAVFDRSGNSYHGVIAALADSIREQGIKL